MRILLTGGSGRLGHELRSLIPGVIAPPRSKLELTDPKSIARALETHHPDVVIHAAAYTDVKGAERERERCWQVNVGGTRHLVQALCDTHKGATLVHISTDYVFAGTTGNYHEDDPTGPPRNHYALSKLVAEEVARVAPAHLVIRTSFRPREWPYPVAFRDVFTSQDYVDVIAPQIALAVVNLAAIPYTTLHIATERKSVYALAKRRKPDVQPGSKTEAGVALPDDISLNTERWQTLKTHLKERV